MLAGDVVLSPVVACVSVGDAVLSRWWRVQSKSSVEEAVNAVGWVHQISGLPSIFSIPICSRYTSGFAEKFSQAKSKKGASDSGHAIGIGW